MLDLQKYLLSNKTPEDLHKDFAINFKRHQIYNNLVLFKYDQIESPKNIKIVNECRGIILDEENNWSVVSRSFDRFFNYGEGFAAEIDWKTARVQEKLDGSICCIYYYNNAWQVQTSGSPDAGGEVNGMALTFSQLFWQTWDKMGWQLPETSLRTCFSFELMTPWNRIVVRHSEPKLALIGVRHLDNGEIPVSWFKETFNFETVKEFPLGSWEEIVKSFDNISPVSQEGYVVVDDKFNRVKVKHPGYVALHHMKDGIHPRSVLEIVRSGEIGEILVHFPEFAEQFNETGRHLDLFVKELETTYEQIKDIEAQKDFAIQAVKSKCSGVLFALRNGKTDSVRNYVKNMNVKHLIDFLGIKDMEVMKTIGDE